MVLHTYKTEENIKELNDFVSSLVLQEATGMSKGERGKVTD